MREDGGHQGEIAGGSVLSGAVCRFRRIDARGARCPVVHMPPQPVRRLPCCQLQEGFDDQFSFPAIPFGAMRKFEANW